MPPPDLEGGVLDSSVGSDPTATASSSTLEDIPSLIERAIAKLPLDLAAHAVDTKRKARSQDPGWKYGWWPDPSVDAGPIRFPTEKREENLVQIGFSTCNPTRTSYT